MRLHEKIILKIRQKSYRKKPFSSLTKAFGKNIGKSIEELEHLLEGVTYSDNQKKN